MSSIFRISIRPKSSILAKYRDLPYKLEEALAEFIDNSTDSFFKNKDKLNAIGQKACRVDILVEPNQITITDNAFGMNINDFKRSVVLDSPPEDTSGRSEKGMGLKTAATWLGNTWSVKTTEYGNNVGFFAQLNVNEIEKEAPEEIMATEFDCDKALHYTVITIKNLRKNITTNALNKTMDKLSQMFSMDIRNKELILTINKQQLKYEFPEFWLDPKTQEPYKQNFSVDFSYDGRKYYAYGWIGIRKTGSLTNEGFSIIRKGRAIRTGYKPKKIFGGPNSYSQQRLIGEIYLDKWDVTHIKNDIQWEGGLEDKLLDKVKKEINHIMRLAESLRISKDYESPEAQTTIAKQNENKFKGLKNVDTVASPTTSPTSPILTATEEKTNKEETQEPIAIENPVITIPFKNKVYEFEISYFDNLTNDWITIEKTNEPDKYRIILNIELEYFKSYNDDRKKVEFLQKIAVSISTALLLSKENGNDDYYIMLDFLNRIVKNVK